MTYETKESLLARSVANGMKTNAASDTGNIVHDIGEDLSRAADRAKEAAARYPGKQVGIVVSPGVALSMALISIKVVGDAAKPLDHLNVLANSMKNIDAARTANGSIKYSTWQSVPVFIDRRVDYINVGVLSQEPAGEPEVNKAGGYGFGRDAAVN